MPKYYEFKVAGYYLYFTSFCTVACMHVHASDDTILQNGRRLNDREIAKIQAFIKDNYKEMYKRWSEYSKLGFYGSND